MSDAERTDDDLYDTVIGYRGGNWIYEWATQKRWCGNKSLCVEEDPATQRSTLAACGLLANIAAYPHLKGDDRRGAGFVKPRL